MQSWLFIVDISVYGLSGSSIGGLVGSLFWESSFLQLQLLPHLSPTLLFIQNAFDKGFGIDRKHSSPLVERLLCRPKSTKLAFILGSADKQA